MENMPSPTRTGYTSKLSSAKYVHPIVIGSAIPVLYPNSLIQLNPLRLLPRKRSTLDDNPSPRNFTPALAWGFLGLLIVVTMFRSWLRRRTAAFKSSVRSAGILPTEDPENRDVMKIIENAPHHYSSD
ncbi:hypothetical protein IW262DRAFT_1460658 [Armillaria fumosa]|nr:hypothetical protein IW262DRAFT_1460658 [Armillaria fumosa]